MSDIDQVASPMASEGLLATKRLSVDNALGGLPLLALAADVATHYRRMIVAAVSLPPDINGVAWPKPKGVVILLDPVLIDVGPTSIESAWAHELAHTIDWLDGRVGGRSPKTHERRVERRERFADRLAVRRDVGGSADGHRAGRRPRRQGGGRPPAAGRL